jgi:hypothetical protein
MPCSRSSSSGSIRGLLLLLLLLLLLRVTLAPGAPSGCWLLVNLRVHACACVRLQEHCSDASGGAATLGGGAASARGNTHNGDSPAPTWAA